MSNEQLHAEFESFIKTSAEEAGLNEPSLERNSEHPESYADSHVQAAWSGFLHGAMRLAAEVAPEENTNFKVGQPLEGGFFAGYLNNCGALFAIVAAPKSLEISGAWDERGLLISGANSYHNGAENTAAMAAAGCKIAIQVQADGWHIPSYHELNLLYRAFKPSAEENYKHLGGDNTSSCPACHPYTKDLPAQTAVDDFKVGDADAFEDTWYWSSTQYSDFNAWIQYFSDGYQRRKNKSYKGRVRPVRWIPVTQ